MQMRSASFPVGVVSPLISMWKLARFVVEADVALLRIVAFFPIVDAFERNAALCLRPEVEPGRQHLLHQQTCRDGLERIVHGLRDGFLRGVGLRNQVREPGLGLAGRVTGRAPDDLHDLGQARPVADRQRVIAPNPVEAFLRHAERNDDVDVLPVVLLVWVPERCCDPLTLGRVVVNQIGDP